jgi:PAP2 superfamily
MTLTKTLTKTKTKTKDNQTTSTEFPGSYRDSTLANYVELPRFCRGTRWQHIPIGPLPGPEETEDELRKLRKRQDDFEERRRRQPEILAEADGDPPYFQRILLFGKESNTYALMQAMSLVGAVVAAHYKFKFVRPRPSQLEPALRPLIDVPGHPSFPSGHAIQMFLIAQALGTVVRNHEIAEQLAAIAARVAENREWAGLHYPSDTHAGKELAYAVYPDVEDAYEELFKSAAREWL